MANFFRKSQENQEYLSTKISPLIEKLYKDLVFEKPVEPIDYIISWMQREKLGQNKPRGIPQRLDDQKMNYEQNFAPKQSEKQFTSPHEISKNADSKKKANESPAESEESEADEKELENKLEKMKNANGRSSVSSEVYGSFNKKAQFVPKTIIKSEDQSNRIRQKIGTAWMFSNVGAMEKEILIKVMEEKRFKKNDVIIKQGDKYGQHLFVVDSGELDCVKEFEKGKEPKFLKKYKSGDAFGELALLYNAPRAATIKCFSEECVLFALDREAFNHIVREATAKKREKYEKLMEKIELLKNVDSYEKMQLIDALKPVTFQKGEFIIKQGDQGNTFYFIEQGDAIATKVKVPNGKAEKVMDYHSGDYFGELALLKNEPRAANVVAETDISLLSLDRESFNRLLGPLDEIMRREMNKYK